jgi:archaellum biogenesis ATPase FlaH
VKLNAYDRYALARLIGGLVIDDDWRLRCSSTGVAIIERVQPVPHLDRARLLSTLVSASEYHQITLVNVNVPPPRVTLSLLTTHQLMTLPKPKLLRPGIPEDGLTVLYGESGVGKSFIALNYALNIAMNGMVIYVPTEGLRGYVQRLQAWEKYHQHALPGSLYFLTAPLTLMDKTGVEELIRQINGWRRSHRLLLVVIDTLAMSMIGADENSARDMGLAVAAVRAIIAALQCAVLLVHHTGKSATSERGSSALRGNADSMIRVSSYDDLLSIENTKAKDFEPFARQYMLLKPVHVGADTSLVPVPYDRLDGDRRTFSRLQGDLVAVLALETCLNGVTLRELAELTGAPLATLHRAVSKLIKAGYVQRCPKGYQLSAAGLELAQRDPSDPLVDPLAEAAFSRS